MNISKTIAVGLCVVVFGIMPTVANAQYEDFSFGDVPDYSFDNTGYGYENYSYGDVPDYSFDNIGGVEREFNPAGGVEREYNPLGVEREYNPLGVEREYNPNCGYDCDIFCGYDCEVYYNASCGCYEVSSRGGSYGGGYGGGFKMPSFGGMTITPPSYPSYPTPRPTPTPSYPQPTPQRPTPTTPSTPVNINNVNTNTNTNVNTNVTTVTPVTPGPIVQYVAPSYPVYPTYLPTYYSNYYNQAPYCVITVTQQGYNYGMITLTWSSSGATSAYITPQVGQVAPNGSTSLYAYGNTAYSLTVSGPGGTYTCRTQNYVAPYTPTSPYVSLSQIPYTGLALGPIGNMIYWTSLISLAVAGAYLLLNYKGGVLALATSVASRTKRGAAEEVSTTLEESPVQSFELPVASAAMTRDAMKIVRAEDGTPRLVISRS